MQTVEAILEDPATTIADSGEGVLSSPARRICALAGLASFFCTTGLLTGLMPTGFLAMDGAASDASAQTFLLFGALCGLSVTMAALRGIALPARPLLPAATAVLVLGAALVAFSSAIGPVDFGAACNPQAMALAGIALMACGDVGVFLLWGRLLSSLPPTQTLGLITAAYVAGTVCAIVACTNAPSHACIAMVPVALLSGVLGAPLLLRQNAPTPLHESRDTAGTPSQSERLVEAVRFLWKPLAASIICALIAGLSRTFPASAGLAEVQVAARLAVGLAVLLALGLPRVTRKQKTSPSFGMSAFYQVIIPVVAIVLLIVPFLLSIAPPGLELAVGLVNSAGFPLMDIAVLSMLATAAHVLEFPSDIAFGAQRALGALAMMAGVWAAPHVMPQTIQFVCALLLAAYLTAMVTSTVRHLSRAAHTSGGTGASSAPVPPKGLETLCGELARTHSLTAREAQILPLLARGRGSTWIAERLCISIQTVKTHTKHIHEKLGVSSREELLDLVAGDSADDQARQRPDASG